MDCFLQQQHSFRNRRRGAKGRGGGVMVLTKLFTMSSPKLDIQPICLLSIASQGKQPPHWSWSHWWKTESNLVTYFFYELLAYGTSTRCLKWVKYVTVLKWWKLFNHFLEPLLFYILSYKWCCLGIPNSTFPIQ